MTVPSGSMAVLLLRPQPRQSQLLKTFSMGDPLSRRRPATGAYRLAGLDRRRESEDTTLPRAPFPDADEDEALSDNLEP